jgi:hypothetical protein
MNLWRAWAPAADGKGRRVVWAASERECRKLANNELGRAACATVKSLDVPTNKAALIGWLNSNVSNIAF